MSIFLNSTFTLGMFFSSDFCLSAQSDQETVSLSIDCKSSDKCEVGRFVLRIKTENSNSVLCCFNNCECVPFAFRVLFLILICIRVESRTSPIVITWEKFAFLHT